MRVRAKEWFFETLAPCGAVRKMAHFIRNIAITLTGDAGLLDGEKVADTNAVKLRIEPDTCVSLEKAEIIGDEGCDFKEHALVCVRSPSPRVASPIMPRKSKCWESHVASKRHPLTPS